PARSATRLPARTTAISAQLSVAARPIQRIGAVRWAPSAATSAAAASGITRRIHRRLLILPGSSPAKTEDHLQRHGSKENCHAQGHGQAIKLGQPILHWPEQDTQQARDLADDVDQAIHYV